MEERLKETGVLYEKLLMCAYQLDSPSTELGADRRLYYLLHYIKIGFDLRETGYPAQFNSIKNSILQCLETFMFQELHREERIAIRKLMKELNEAWSETVLEKLIRKALKITARLHELVEEAA